MIILGGSQPFGTQALPATIDLAQNWGQWMNQPDLELLTCSTHSSAHDMDACHFLRRYGIVKYPWENSAQTRTPLNIVNLWVRVSLQTPSGPQPIWYGRVYVEDRRVFGDANGSAGVQSWTAYGPAEILKKIRVGKSVWTDAVGYESQLDWVPDINDRIGRRLVKGNRSDATGSQGCYLYGGTNIWSHYDYAMYLFAAFCNEDNILWTLGGQAAILQGLQETIHLETSQTVDEVLRKLIPPKLGLDYCVVANDQGFEVRVFALTAKDYSYAGATLPANPYTLQFTAGETILNQSTELELDETHGYGRVRILGARVISCFTLDANGGDGRQLTNRWEDDDENAYIGGDPTDVSQDDAEKNDTYRKLPRFHAVFQCFGAPDDWDWNDGAACPAIQPDGSLGDSPANYQVIHRNTLHWTPLRANFDYTQSPPQDKNPEGYEAEFLPPYAYVKGVDPDSPLETEATIYRAAHSVGFGVSVLHADWGLSIHGAPNHRLAKNHWDGAGDSAYNPNQELDAYDWQETAITIAATLDQRLRFEVQSPDWTASMGTLDVELPTAEYWILCAHTIVGVDEDGQPQYSPSTPVVLRQDLESMGLAMAGVISRYQASRMRAVISYRGLWPYSSLITGVLTYVEAGGQSMNLQAPVTSITYTQGDAASTVIRAGYAQG